MIIYILIGILVGMLLSYTMIQLLSDGSLILDISDPEEPKAIKIEGLNFDELVDGHRKKFILKIVRIK